MNCHLLLRYGPRDNLVKILPFAFSWIRWLQRYTQILNWIHSSCTDLAILALLACLARHSGSHWCFQFLSSIPYGFFDFPVLRVNEVDSSYFSSIIDRSFFNWPFLLLPQLSISSQFRPEFWPLTIWPGCRLPFCQSLPGPLISVWRFLLLQCKLSETCPRMRQISWSIDIPRVIDAAFLPNVQIRLLSSGGVNVVQWNTEWFFSRRVKLDSRFNVMAEYEVSWHGRKVMYLFTGIRKRVVRWRRERPFWFSKKISLTFSSDWVFPYQGGCYRFLISREFDSSICFLKIFHFEKWYFFCYESFRVDSDASIVSNSSRSAISTSPFQIPPAYRAYPRNNRGKTFLSKLMDAWLVFRRNRVILNQWTKRNDRFLKWFSKTPFVWTSH